MILLISSWLAVVILLFFLLSLDKSFTIYNPLVLFIIIFFIFGFGKIIYLYYFAKPSVIYFNLMSNNFYQLYKASLLSYLFLFFVFIGFAGFLRGVQSSYVKKTTSSTSTIFYKGDNLWGLLVSLGILLISLSSLYMFLFSGEGLNVLSAKRFLADGADPSSRLNDMNYILFKLIQLCELPLYLSYFYYLLGKSKFKKTWLLIFILSLFIIVFNAIIFSNRAALIILFIDLLLFFIYIKGKVSLKIVILTILFFFSLFMMMSILRSGGGIDEKTLLDHIFSGRYFADISKLSVIVNSLDNSIVSPPVNFSSLLSFVSSYMNIGRFVGENMFHTYHSGVPMGIIGELYWINGLWGVVLGGLLIGILFKSLYLYLKKQRRINMFVLFAIIFIYSRSIIFLSNNGLGVTIYQILLDFFSLFIFFLLTYLNKRKNIVL